MSFKSDTPERDAHKSIAVLIRLFISLVVLFVLRPRVTVHRTKSVGEVVFGCPTKWSVASLPTQYNFVDSIHEAIRAVSCYGVVRCSCYVGGESLGHRSPFMCRSRRLTPIHRPRGLRIIYNFFFFFLPIDIDTHIAIIFRSFYLLTHRYNCLQTSYFERHWNVFNESDNSGNRCDLHFSRSYDILMLLQYTMVIRGVSVDNTHLQKTCLCEFITFK